jgi:hypothetical protein
MFGSETLDIVIGLVFFFLFASLICSAVREGLESILKMRALDLERAIRELLADKNGTTVVSKFFQHPIISALFLGEYDPGKLTKTKATLGKGDLMHMRFSGRRNLPSYIPAANFAQAVLSLVAQGALATPSAQPPVDTTLSAANIRASIGNIASPQLKQALLSAFDLAKGDIDATRTNLENWFNSSMDRVSGWYKRRTQLYLFLIGLLAAAALNLDAVNVTRHMIQDRDFRDLVVKEAVATAKAGEPKPNFDDQRKALSDLGFPMGWPAQQLKATDGSAKDCPLFSWTGLFMLAGWLITAIAVMFGAPFWFDILNKLVALRAAGKEPPKDGTEAADAKTAGAK